MPQLPEDRYHGQYEWFEGTATTRLIINAALDAIICIDTTGIITDWNPQAEKIFGWTFAEVKGLSLTETIIPEPYRNRHRQGLQHYLQTGEGPVLNRILEITALRRDGKEFPVELSILPIHQQDSVFFCAFLRDITERKTAETQQQLHAKALEQKNRELEQFAYIASHDLQEPLRTTSSFVDLLRQQYEGRLDEPGDKYLVYITQAVNRMQVLINDLLRYSRIGRKITLVMVDCNLLLKEVLADLNTAIQEEQAIITTANLPELNGYDTELKMLFQNLISNSIKFRKKEVPPQIKISATQSEKGWTFAFADNGIGIEERYYERIFIPFQRLHTWHEYEGSGIGLAHCKKIVELHGGNIWVESVAGEGSTFYFTIQQ